MITVERMSIGKSLRQKKQITYFPKCNILSGLIAFKDISALTVRGIFHTNFITFSFVMHSLQSQLKKYESLNRSFLSSVGYNRSI